MEKISVFDLLIKDVSTSTLTTIETAITDDGTEIAFSTLGFAHYIPVEVCIEVKELIDTTLDYYKRKGFTPDDVRMLNDTFSDEYFEERLQAQKRSNEQVKKPRRKKTVIYVIRDIKSSSLKVGKSRNPESRLRSHQTSNPNKLELIFQHSGYAEDEVMLHEKLKDAGFHIHGEWFADSQEVLNIVQKHFENTTDGKRTHSNPSID